jgi:hypothetical protein
MGSNWMLKEAEKIKDYKDVAILEKPDIKKELDDMLIKKYWPAIEVSLKDTGYIYSPDGKPKTEFEFSYELTRSLTFMLFDFESAIFRGKLSLSPTGWMLERESFLQLTDKTDPEVIFDIIGDPGFKGFPPTLEIHKDMPYIYQIHFQDGSGSNWLTHTDEIIHRKINEVINLGVKLYEFTIDGCIIKKDVNEFLQLAWKLYEAF